MPETDRPNRLVATAVTAALTMLLTTVAIVAAHDGNTEGSDLASAQARPAAPPVTVAGLRPLP